MNFLKRKDVLTSLLLNLSLEYAIKNVQENQEKLEMNCTHLLVYTDDFKLLRTQKVPNSTKTLLYSSKATANKSTYRPRSAFRHLKAEQNHDSLKVCDNG